MDKGVISPLYSPYSFVNFLQEYYTEVFSYILKKYYNELDRLEVSVVNTFYNINENRLNIYLNLFYRGLREKEIYKIFDYLFKGLFYVIEKSQIVFKVYIYLGVSINEIDKYQRVLNIFSKDIKYLKPVYLDIEIIFTESFSDILLFMAGGKRNKYIYPFEFYKIDNKYIYFKDKIAYPYLREVDEYNFFNKEENIEKIDFYLEEYLNLIPSGRIGYYEVLIGDFHYFLKDIFYMYPKVYDLGIERTAYRMCEDSYCFKGMVFIGCDLEKEYNENIISPRVRFLRDSVYSIYSNKERKEITMEYGLSNNDNIYFIQLKNIAEEDNFLNGAIDTGGFYVNGYDESIRDTAFIEFFELLFQTDISNYPVYIDEEGIGAFEYISDEFIKMYNYVNLGNNNDLYLMQDFVKEVEVFLKK